MYLYIGKLLIFLQVNQWRVNPRITQLALPSQNWARLLSQQVPLLNQSLVLPHIRSTPVQQAPVTMINPCHVTMEIGASLMMWELNWLLTRHCCILSKWLTVWQERTTRRWSALKVGRYTIREIVYIVLWLLNITLPYNYVFVCIYIVLLDLAEECSSVDTNLMLGYLLALPQVHWQIANDISVNFVFVVTFMYFDPCCRLTLQAVSSQYSPRRNRLCS